MTRIIIFNIFFFLDFAQRLVLTGGSKELKCYNRALHELFKTFEQNLYVVVFGLIWHSCSLHGNNEDLSADSTVVPLQESQVLFTEMGMCVSQVVVHFVAKANVFCFTQKLKLYPKLI